MKKNIKIIITSLMVVLTIFANGCDVIDSLETFPVNIPMSFEFNTSGNNSNIFEQSTECLTDNQTYQDYQDKINSLSYVEAAFRTGSFLPTSMRGNITISVSNNFGTTLFSQTIQGANPADYINTPFVLALNESEIQAINNYVNSALESSSSICFTGTLSVSITDGSAPYSLTGYIDVVFEAETKL